MDTIENDVWLLCWVFVGRLAQLSLKQALKRNSVAVKLYHTKFSNYAADTDLNENSGSLTDLAKKSRQHGSEDLRTSIHPPRHTN